MCSTRWTFIHAQTESGDDYYTAVQGIIAESEVDSFIDAWLEEEAEYVWNYHIEYTPREES